MTKKSKNKIVTKKRSGGSSKISAKFLIPCVSLGTVGIGGAVAGAIIYCLPKSPTYVTTFKIHFDANGGGEIVGTDYCSLTKTTTFKNINTPNVTPKGTKVFNCWTTDKEGQHAVAPNQELTKETTLYATYKDPTVTHSVKFSAGDTGATLQGISNVTVDDGTTFGSFNKPFAYKANTEEIQYNFLYWSTDGTETGKIDNDKPVTTDLVLTPVFEEIGVKFIKLTFNALKTDLDSGCTIMINGKDAKQATVTTSISTLVTWGESNKPTISKQKSVSGTIVNYDFDKWVRYDQTSSTYVEVKNDDKFTADETIYPKFVEVPEILQSEYYLTDPDHTDWGVGVIMDGTESIGENIIVEFENKTDKVSYPKETFDLPVNIGTKITSISPNFLAGCTAFNQTITIPENVVFIGNNFLVNCTAFNNGASEAGKIPLVVPATVKSIGDSFLTGCTTFNQVVTLNEGLEKISSYFMMDCQAFNQPITIPASVTTIGYSFFYQNYNFNSVVTFKDDSQLNTVYPYFMYYCWNFSKDLDMSKCTKLTEITDSFMKYANAFSGEITLPSSIVTIGDWFLSWIQGGTGYKIDVSNLTSLKTIGSYVFYDATNFSCELDFSKCTNLETIGGRFLSFSTNYNSAITLPSSITSVGVQFMYNCNATTTTGELITLNFPVASFKSDTNQTTFEKASSSYSKYRIKLGYSGDTKSKLLNAIGNEGKWIETVS